MLEAIRRIISDRINDQVLLTLPSYKAILVLVKQSEKGRKVFLIPGTSKVSHFLYVGQGSEVIGENILEIFEGIVLTKVVPYDVRKIGL